MRNLILANIETLWQELTVSALLGTLRRPFVPSQVDGAIGEAVLVGLDEAGEDHERALLHTTALAALYRRAGQQPAAGGPTPPAACPPDTRPACSLKASAFLEAILNSETIALLPEWAEIAAQHQQRVREERLPELLQYLHNHMDLRDNLLSLLGERGRWLAQLNPEWQEIVPYEDEIIWHEGKRKERAAFLSNLRRRDPENARELLMMTWQSDSPSERALFLHVLESNLSLADEPFLESALDDRRQEVRQEATRLLRQLPQSRLAQRMSERARRLLRWKQGLLRSLLEVHLPEGLDAEMERDGIEGQPPQNSQLGEKAWWLMQILSQVPPHTWSEGWNKRPLQLLEALRKHEWEQVVYNGWMNAAITYQDADWLEALLLYEMQHHPKHVPGGLFLSLPAAAKEKRMIALLREMPSLSYEQPASIFLCNCRHPWSQELTLAVAACIVWHLEKADIETWRWDRMLREVAVWINPKRLNETTDRIKYALRRKEGGDSAVEKMIEVLTFRQEMRQAFENPEGD